MGFRFRKSVKIAPGVRLNFGKKGVGVSVGAKGFRVSKSSRGTTLSAGVPGTGIYYQENLSSKKRPQRRNYENLVKQQEKLTLIDEARKKVEEHEAYLDLLMSVHEEASHKIDWHRLVTSPPPFRIHEEDGPNVKELKRQIEEFKPSWRDRLFNRGEAKKQFLIDQMDQAREKDHALYLQWEEQVNRAKKVLGYDLNMWQEIMEENRPFEDMESLGCDVTYRLDPPKGKANLTIHNRSIVPAIDLSLTKTGKLSQKEMAKGKYFQIYQDFVCSSALRIAREFFHLLPMEEVVVNVYDVATADSDEKFGCILAVRFPKDKFETLQFRNIDCSDTIQLFEHNMKFLKTKGFKLVEEIF